MSSSQPEIPASSSGNSSLSRGQRMPSRGAAGPGGASSGYAGSGDRASVNPSSGDAGTGRAGLSDPGSGRPVAGSGSGPVPREWNPRRDAPLDFPDRELGEMTAADYDQLGFLCGLEVHQQLLTATKLFCRCPAGRSVRRFDAEVLRRMRPTLSELGEYDGCALMEFKTRKEIVYRLDRETVCTYELDDTPPFAVDREAVRIGLEICQLFDLDLVTELHVMRKQYLDGSIPTGFQRTIMMGLTGAVPFREPRLGVDKLLRIRQLSLEEDACREVSDLGHRITFRTDRLGTPLTEVVTEPDLLTPFEVQVGARLVARVTRACGKVRRGPGAARQDVNVSIAGSRRVEIKGVGHHRKLPELVHVEAFRQLHLLQIRAELLRRGVSRAALDLPAERKPWETSPLVLDITSLLERCDFEPIRQALDRQERVCALRLPGYQGILSHRTQPGLTFANEIADRLRVVACLSSRPSMIHSELEGFGLDHAEWHHVSTALSSEPEDTVVVLWAPRPDLETAVREVFARAQEALEGVPAETRQSFFDGTTGFERILPGPNRMYPDTDTPPVPVPDSWVEEIRATLPERPWEREARYEKLGLDLAVARRLVDAEWSDLFDAVAPEAGECARRVAFALEKRLPCFRRRTRVAALPGEERLAPLVRALERGELRLDGFEPALDRLLKEPAAEVAGILHAFRPCGAGDPELAAALRRTLEAAAQLPGRSPEVLLRWSVGQVMGALRGRVDSGQVRRALRRELDLLGSRRAVGEPRP